MTEYDHDMYQDLIDKINRVQKGSLKWWTEDRDTMHKVILTDESRKYRRALYIDKKKSEKEALTNLIKSYCIDHGVSY